MLTLRPPFWPKIGVTAIFSPVGADIKTSGMKISLNLDVVRFWGCVDAFSEVSDELPRELPMG